jgi:hypothetical protein
MIPSEHLSFVERTLQRLGIPPEGEGRDGVRGWLHSVAKASHRSVLIALAPPLPARSPWAAGYCALPAALRGTSSTSASTRGSL